MFMHFLKNYVDICLCQWHTYMAMAFNYRKMKRARELAGLNRSQLAAEMGVTKQAVSYIEWGLRQHPPLIKKYLDFLGKRPENFYIPQAEFEKMREEDSEGRKLAGSRK